MSERILRALMQMFAIIAKVDGVTNTGRSIVESFLKQQLNQEQVETYLKIFDDFIEAQQNGSKRIGLLGSSSQCSAPSPEFTSLANAVHHDDLYGL